MKREGHITEAAQVLEGRSGGETCDVAAAVGNLGMKVPTRGVVNPLDDDLVHIEFRACSQAKSLNPGLGGPPSLLGSWPGGRGRPRSRRQTPYSPCGGRSQRGVACKKQTRAPNTKFAMGHDSGGPCNTPDPFFIRAEVPWEGGTQRR